MFLQKSSHRDRTFKGWYLRILGARACPRPRGRVRWFPLAIEVDELPGRGQAHAPTGNVFSQITVFLKYLPLKGLVFENLRGAGLSPPAGTGTMVPLGYRGR